MREIARSNDIVYEAVDVNLGRRIALKELNIAPSLTGQPRRDRIERFNREARAVGRLGHPNIVSVFDFGEEQGRHFIAMEYLEGQSLRDMMNVRGAFSLKDAIDIASQVLDALAYAHANRVIHRDIKPDNIHILPGGQVKLTDFGIARLTEEPALTIGGEVFGTPSYMSPEQIEGRTLDHRSDLFSLGVVLYEMLAGRKPFVGDSVISITYAIMHAEPPPLPGVPMGVEQVVRRALSKSPMQRQDTAEQMKLDLRNAEQTPAVFLPPSYGTQMGMGQTGMGAMGPGYGYPGGGMGGAPSYPQGSYGGAYSTPQTALGGGSLPWSWNNAGSPAVASQQQVPGALPQTGASGISPFAGPPFPARPPDPAFTMSPSGRTFLLSVALAALLGGGIAIGVIAFLHSYEQYRISVGSQHVAALIDQGATAYNQGDKASSASDKGHYFRLARKLFEQAQASNPTTTERTTLDHNLTATYIQLARLAAADGQWQEASDLYEKALTLSPSNATAHTERANALAELGQNEAANRERAAAQGSADGSSLGALNSHESASADPQQFVNGRRAHAQQLIDEGDQLANQGDVDGARQKWREAMSVAPATPERDVAQQRLEQTQPQFHPFDEP